MKTFNVYRHPIHGFDVVKVGFSWSACFFTFIWLLAKRLWADAGMWLGVAFVFSVIEIILKSAGGGEVHPLMAFIFAIGYTILWLLPAFKGNAWREENLTERGYLLLGTEQAETPDAALAKYSTEHKSVVTVMAPSEKLSASPVGAKPPVPIPPTAATSAGNSEPVSMVIDDDAIYTAIAKELETSTTDKGLWTRLFAECDGDDNRTKVAYIKQRAVKLKATEQGRLAEIARQCDEDASRARQAELQRQRLSRSNITQELAEQLGALSRTNAATLIIKSVLRNDVPGVEALLSEAPLLVAVWDSFGDTPVHYAAREKNVEMARLLLGRGAPTDVTNMCGQTPLDLARTSGNQELIALLSPVQ